MSTISKKHYYDRVFIRKINYHHLQSSASSTYIILESKIPYYEAVTLNLTYSNSHIQKNPDAIHRTRRITHNWHILVNNRRPSYSRHYPRVENKFMNINGTSTHRSDIYFIGMMLAFEDFRRRHCLKSVQSTPESWH